MFPRTSVVWMDSTRCDDRGQLVINVIKSAWTGSYSTLVAQRVYVVLVDLGCQRKGRSEWFPLATSVAQAVWTHG